MGIYSYKSISMAQFGSELSAEIFRDWDTDNSGLLSFDELKSKMLEFFPGFPDAVLQTLLASSDADGNGELDVQEFQSFLGSSPILIKLSQSLSEFKSWDMDNDNSLDFDELKAHVGDDLSDKTLETIIGLCDKNGDKVLDVREFLEFRDLTSYSKIFAKIDANKNGEISVEEIVVAYTGGSPVLSPLFSSADDLLHLFKLAKHNGDALDYLAFYDMMKMAEWRKLFYTLDADSSGSLSFDELAVGVLPGNEEVLRSLIIAHDSDRNGELEFQEFLNMVASNKWLF